MGYHHKGTWDTLKWIYKNEGIIGYFKGNGTNVVRMIPYSAVQVGCERICVVSIDSSLMSCRLCLPTVCFLRVLQINHPLPDRQRGNGHCQTAFRRCPRWD
jgi:hypothetical protein